MSEIYLTSIADLEKLASAVIGENEYEDLIEFVLEIDNQVQDLKFTVDLRNALNRVIANEEVGSD